MALFLTPRALARCASLKKNITRNLSEVKKSDGRSGICSVPEPPACPPCEPAPRPACRPAEPAHGPRGLRRVCCAPSAGQRPPCTPTPPACPKTCRHANVQKNVDISKCESERHEKCGDNLDRVARRLAAAELTRRLDYEREVSEAKPLPVSDPIAYNLMDERECMRATDGHDYTTPKQPTTQTRCGPCRIPPPPCPVHLDSADNCKISHDQHLEPCAHRPRIFLEIDRSQNSRSTEKIIASSLNPEKDGTSAGSTSSSRPSKEKSIASPLNPEKYGTSAGSTSSSRPSTSGSLKTRIIETFRSSKGSCPRRPCQQSCTSTNARYAGDTSWCANIPSPASAPANCKEPSLTERLRRRSGALCSKHCGSRHRIHTTPCIEKASESKLNTENVQSESNINKLESILNERLQLKEAGLGRVVVMQQQIQETKPLSTGLMELQIPPTSDSVRVRVCLNFENSKSTICEAPSTSNFPVSHNLSSCNSDSSGSWLSIKNLQKKITGCRKHESQQTSEKTSTLSTNGPKSQCGKDATKEPCTPNCFGKVGPRGKTTPVPSPHTPPQSTCKGYSKRDPPRCSFKQDLLNSMI